MPIIAVGVAVVADVAAGAAAVAGTVTALEVVGAVGATIAAVGAVTGNKALTYVGAGLGLVGAIGSVAAAAGVLGDSASAPLWGAAPAASTADTAATTTDTIDTLAGTAGDVGGGTGTADAAGGFDVNGQSLASTAADTAAPVTTPASGTPLGAQPADNVFEGASTSGAAPEAGSATNAGPVGQAAPAVQTAAPSANAVTQMPAGGFTPPAGDVNATALAATTPPTGAELDAAINGTSGTPSSSGVLQSILNYAQKNPLLSAGLITGGMSLISGIGNELSGVTPAQVLALNAQAASNQASANLTSQQTANLAQPRSTAALAPVTGTPNNIITPPTAGLINGAPQVNVTGVPA